MSRRTALPILLLCPLWSGCAGWFFSGEHWVDRTRPVALVETTGGLELAATTEFGVLLLGRTATAGPCRVHYFLGPTPVEDAGQLVATGSLFLAADIDLKTQLARCLDRPLRPDDELVAMWTSDGLATTTVPVQLARIDGVDGDVLAATAVPLPVGATVLVRDAEDQARVVGLIAGTATLDHQGNRQTVHVFAGLDRLRELVGVPRQHPADLVPRYRPDDITVLKPRAESPPK